MNLRDPVTCSEAWVLSTNEKKKPISIPNDVVKNFGRQDVIVLDFLYRSYLKQLRGVILNEEQDLNSQLQVAAFLGAIYKSLNTKFLVLVLCPDDVITNWHYYMSKYGNFEVKIIKPHTVPEDFDQEAAAALLLSFSNIKLAEFLKEYDFFSVIIDNFDEVATKLAIRRLQGNFNIGITTRNFYVNPDQKIQWTMLNWANTGCVGKLADFYEIDNDNFANFRDNYKEWWFRLTWKFCDSFVKPTLEEKGKLNTIVRNWGKTHNLGEFKNENKINKRKRRGKASLEIEEEHIDSEDNKQSKRKKKVYKKKVETTKDFKKITYKTGSNQRANTSKKRDLRSMSFSSDSSDSSDTIIYDNESYQQLDENEVPENDEPPIGGLMKNYEPLSDSTVENEQLLNKQKNVSLEKNDDDSKSDNDSVSSGEQLLCSLVGNKNKKSSKGTKTLVKNNDQDFYDESDTFLRSVASTSSDLSPVKNSKRAEEFFDKILDNSESKFNYLTQMEMELTEKDVVDIPSESDDFFKGIFNNTKKSNNNLDDDTTETKEAEIYSQGDDGSFLKGIFNSNNETKRNTNRNEENDVRNLSQTSNGSFSNGGVDVDSLVAEVMELVGGK